ncbi:MAG: hypothetical protein ABIP20_02165 [Chthoniobacteraceae bacterium]
MKAAFAIWIEVAELKRVAELLRVITSGLQMAIHLEVRNGRMGITSSAVSAEIVCECAEEFRATVTVGQLRKLLKLPRPLPKINGKIMFAARRNDGTITSEWAVAKKVMFQP